MSGAAVLTEGPQVHLYAKLVFLFPLAFIASPVDLIPDGLLFFGQIDDLIVVRFSYVLLKTIIDPVVLDECRKQSRRFFPRRGSIA